MACELFVSTDTLWYGTAAIGRIPKAEAVCSGRFGVVDEPCLPGVIPTPANEVLDQNNVIASWEYPERRTSRSSRRKGGASHQ
jgi:hypothetical protein